MPGKLQGPRACSQTPLSGTGAGQTGFISSNAQTGESRSLSLEVYRRLAYSGYGFSALVPYNNKRIWKHTWVYEV